MAISDNKKFLAICEKAKQAICFIYEVATLKRRRIITSSESVAKEFIDVRFAHSEDKMTNFLLTLVSICSFLFCVTHILDLNNLFHFFRRVNQITDQLSGSGTNRDSYSRSSSTQMYQKGAFLIKRASILIKRPMGVFWLQCLFWAKTATSITS